MKKNSIWIIIFFVHLSISYAWHDLTHIAIGQLAGYEKAYNLAAPDVAKIKAGNIEQYNHYSNNNGINKVTSELVMNQIPKYNSDDINEEGGHLYGAIIGSIRNYLTETTSGKYAEFHLVYLGHYLGDLSNPLHNTQYDDFNKKRHSVNDGIVENEIFAHLVYLHTLEIEIKSEEDIIAEIVKLANYSMELGGKMRIQNRNMNEEEAYLQITRSASLFKGILKWIQEKKN
ncbi:MAG: hypothetical protein A2X64_06595 [Ignavibacteria bacterium GWF2_33_9]|nr:MAG: hypothetical protein A2X64_06595 [Ignavibacteria bacterium GWF2_33_9]